MLVECWSSGLFSEVKKTSHSGAVGAQSTNSHYIVRPPNHLFSEDAPVKFMSTSSFETWCQWTEDSEPCQETIPFLHLCLLHFLISASSLFFDHCYFLINAALSNTYTFMSSCIQTLCLSGHSVTACKLHRTFLGAQTIPLQAYSTM